ncbi:hypothetical protein ACFL1B_02375 [Nanoarchaeota archaeon]
MKRMIILVLVAFFLLSTHLGVSTPPTPHNIQGRVLYPGGSGVENGIPVRIHNLNNSNITETQVYAPPIPEFMGFYSATITANTGDFIIVRSWNATHYGETNATVLATTTTVNIELNRTRFSETNVTIVAPEDASSHNSSTIFNVTANVTVLGADGSSCEAIISFGNTSILDVTGSDTNDLGSISRGSSVLTSFEVVGDALGVTNVTVNSTCIPDGMKIHNAYWDTIYLNITDSGPPIVLLISPGNNTENKTMHNITFTYNVSDNILVPNCSLIINGAVNKTDDSITKDVDQEFSQVLSNGFYNWSVNCTDALGQTGASHTYNLSVSVHLPNITYINMSNPLVLVAGKVVKVHCNLTVEDLNGASDISMANATFYSSKSTADADDDNNLHYTNSSCALIGSSAVARNYSCAFSVYYYAVNGTWSCNGTSEDAQGLSGTGKVDTVVEPLFALNTSTDLINYGEVLINGTSSEVIVNITNIGNQNITISVWGYGGYDSFAGDGFAMICPDNNISVDYEKFSEVSIAYDSKKNLSSTAQQLSYVLPKQNSPSLRQNSSYWQLYVPVLSPPLGRGECNGTVVFEASP